MLNGFLVDGNPMGFMSPEIIEILFILIGFIVFLFSLLALFFAGKRNSKRFHYKLWNGKTKIAFWKCITGIVLIFAILMSLASKGLENIITPAFLVLYGGLLLLLKGKSRKSIFSLVLVSFLLAVVSFLIPTYWYSSLTILGIAHITYGLIIKN
jgi:hypothetical protein